MIILTHIVIEREGLYSLMNNMSGLNLGSLKKKKNIPMCYVSRENKCTLSKAENLISS